MYTLSSYVKEVKGVNGSLLINLDSGNELDLNKYESENLNSILNSSDLEWLQEIKKFCNMLIDEGWIVKSNNRYNSEELKYINITTIKGDLKEFSLEKIMIEICTKCTLNCFFCNKSNNNAFASCFCKKWNYDINFQLNEEIIYQLINFGVRKVMIIGGDPFCNFDYLKRIIDVFNNYGFNGEFVIYTNGVNINKNHIKFISNNKNIRINLQLFGFNEEEYYSITGEKGIYEKIDKNIKQLKKHNINTIGTLLVTNVNVNTLFQGKMQDFLIPIGLKYLYKDDNLKKELLYSHENRKVRQNYYTFPIKKETNDCLYSQVFISGKGKVYPCPFLRDYELGDINNESLATIFRKKKHNKFWFLSKLEIDNCKSCKYRMNCLDCRAIEYSIDRNLYSEHYCSVANDILALEKGE